LCSGIYKKQEPSNPLGMLQAALETAEDNKPLTGMVRDAVRNDVISGRTEIDIIHAAREAGILSREDAELLLRQDSQIMELINVDDFAPDQIGRAAGLQRASSAEKRNDDTDIHTP
jgi:acyl-CoA dehydrogenase